MLKYFLLNFSLKFHHSNTVTMWGDYLVYLFFKFNPILFTNNGNFLWLSAVADNAVSVVFVMLNISFFHNFLRRYQIWIKHASPMENCDFALSLTALRIDGSLKGSVSRDFLVSFYFFMIRTHPTFPSIIFIFHPIFGYILDCLSEAWMGSNQ